jgi:hypothetical protein
VIKNDDVVVGTHGRSFWILDDITPLRQWTTAAGSADVHLFTPQEAIRVRWNMNTDTPLPPDEPAGQNPPDGAIINYHLKSAASGPVTLEVLDRAGEVVRSYSSADKAEPIEDEGNVPRYWIRPTQILSGAPGFHRFVWDLHYPALPTQQRSYPIAAIVGNTPKLPLGPWVAPGQYTVRLTVNGRSVTQALTVRMDPRVKTPASDLTQQFTLSKKMYDGMKSIGAALQRIRGQANVDATLERSLNQVQGQLSAVLGQLQGADMTPTGAMIQGAADAERALTEILARVPR